MKPDLLLLIGGMAAVTYALRAAPLLLRARSLPGPINDYLQIVAPALLAALAVVAVAVSGSSGGSRSLSVGTETAAVVACVLVVLSGRSLLSGLALAVGLVTLTRTLNLG